MERLVVTSSPLMWIGSTVEGRLATITSGSRKCLDGFCKCRVMSEKAWDADEIIES